MDVGLGRGKEFVGRERGKETRGVAKWGEAVGSVGGPSLGRGVVAAQRSTYRHTHIFVVPSFRPSFCLPFCLPFLPSFFLSFFLPFPFLAPILFAFLPPFPSLPFLSLIPLRHLKIHPWGFSLGWGVSVPMEGRGLHSTDLLTHASFCPSFLPSCFLLSFLPSFLPPSLPFPSLPWVLFFPI